VLEEMVEDGLVLFLGDRDGVGHVLLEFFDCAIAVEEARRLEEVVVEVRPVVALLAVTAVVRPAGDGRVKVDAVNGVLLVVLEVEFE
jgi:hypothetical protein